MGAVSPLCGCCISVLSIWSSVHAGLSLEVVVLHAMPSMMPEPSMVLFSSMRVSRPGVVVLKDTYKIRPNRTIWCGQITSLLNILLLSYFISLRNP